MLLRSTVAILVIGIAGCGGRTGEIGSTSAGQGGAGSGGYGGAAGTQSGAGGKGGTPGHCGDGTLVCAPEGPSCAGGLTCAFGKSCCESTVVPDGAFIYRSATVSPTSKVTATIASFALDTFPVTVGRFRKFVDAFPPPPAAGAGVNPAVDMSGWHSEWNTSLAPTAEALRASLATCGSFTTWTDQPGPNEDKPIGCLDWYDAFAFCVWDGGRLPGTSEWEYAASAGDEERDYAWGNVATAAELRDCDTLYPDVGAFPANQGKWGQLDMGLFHELTFDCAALVATQVNPVCANPECACIGTQPFDAGRLVQGGGCLEEVGTGVAGNPVGTLATTRRPATRCARATQ